MFLAFLEASSKFSVYENYMYRTKMYISEYGFSEKVFKKVNFLDCSDNLETVTSFLNTLHSCRSSKVIYSVVPQSDWKIQVNL